VPAGGAAGRTGEEEKNMEKLAIRGGTPIITTKFPAWPIWDETDARTVADAVREGVWGIHGRRIDEFAETFSRFQHLKHVIPVANGSFALDLAVEAVGVGPGDEVIVPDYTFMATALAPMRCGARPVLVDVDPVTCNMDPQKMANAISSKTRAIIVVHIGGHPCDMTAIMSIAEKYGIPVIEDCAHAHGAAWEGTSVGSFGSVATFSFQSSKTLPIGEGGAVATNSDRLARLLWALQNCGRAPGEPDYNHYIAATNCRMGNLQAALGVSQLARLEEQCRTRDANGRHLMGLLSRISGILPQGVDARVNRHGFYLFIFQVDDDRVPRDAFREALDAEGVPTELPYPSIHSLDFMRTRGLSTGCFPASDRIADRAIWIYHRVLLAERKDVELIAGAVEKIMHNREQLAPAK
jgi:dTDP-4-amino-4,6-dideoxygalactose transaminase